METGASVTDSFVVVFDCESDALLSTLPGDTHKERLEWSQFTCVCASSIPVEAIKNDTALECAVSQTWWRDVAEEGSNPIVSLLNLFDRAKLIIGFNVLGFDFPLIRRFYRPTSKYTNAAERYIAHRSKTIDVMYRVRDVTTNWFKLDTLLAINNIECKSGDGKNAVKLWEAGRRDELEAYCQQDVRATAQLALLDTVFVSPTTCVSAPAVGVRALLRAMQDTNSVISSGNLLK